MSDVSKKYRVGVDLGGTNIKASIVDENNNIIGRHSVKTLVGRPYEDIIDDMALAINTALSEAKITADDCAFIGVGSPGCIDSKKGVVVFAGNLAWDNMPLTDELHKHFDMPIYLSNDANCAALGEVVAGAAKDCKDVVLVTLGTGVGGGVVYDGKLFEGGGPAGAELGHIILVHNGEPCTCGRDGCFEAYASATALIREATKTATANPDSLLFKLMKEAGEMNGKIPFDAARAGDEAGSAVVKQYVEWLGCGIVDLINIFRPQVVLLSGGVCNQGEYLTDPVNEYVRKYSFAGDRVEIPKVIRASLGNDAGAIGAASLGL